MIEAFVGFIVAVIGLMLLAAALNLVLGLIADWLCKYL